jgi:hypothetical protein
MLKISPPKKEKEKKRALFLKEKFFVWRKSEESNLKYSVSQKWEIK